MSHFGKKQQKEGTQKARKRMEMLTNSEKFKAGFDEILRNSQAETREFVS